MTGENRKLAAILSADVVGYSRLMVQNEAATVQTLKEYRVALERVVARHKGRIVNAPGDNILADFPSAVEAVHAAVEVQKVIEGRNLELPPDRRMQFRVGVNLGDVIEEDDGTIYGDGVNIAARMESLADPGGICISSTVYDAVQGKIDFGFDFLGQQHVKNIARPIPVYRVRAEQGATLPKGTRSGWKIGVAAALVGFAVLLGGLITWQYLRDKPIAQSPKSANDHRVKNSTGPVIAVLPFHNLSGDPEQEFFAEGVSEDVLNQLSQAIGVQVIGRSSSFRYRGPNVNSYQAGTELGAQFVVVGSVRRADRKVRVSAELIESASGKMVWSNVYDRDLTTSELFAVQDDITQSIVAAVASGYGIISQLTRARDRGDASLSSYECVLRAYHYFEYFTEPYHLRARDCLEDAVKRDPQYAEAWGWLAILYANEHAWGFNRREDPLGRSLEAGNKAVSANRNSQMAWEGKAAAHFFRGDWDEFHAAAQKALSINPNNVGTLGNLAWYYMNFGDYDRALPLAKKAIDLSPYPPFWYYHPFWQKYYSDGDYKLALEYAKKGKGEGFFPCYLMLTATYAELGDKSQATAYANRLLEAKPDITSSYRAWANSLHWPQPLVEKISTSLTKAGLSMSKERV